jgi:hypothetical protein
MQLDELFFFKLTFLKLNQSNVELGNILWDIFRYLVSRLMLNIY